jgi:hypothetical protein
VPEQAEVVADIYRRLVDGESLSSVTRWLQSSDHLTPTGMAPHYWSSMSVKNIIKNPVNYGRVVTDRYVESKEKPEDEWRDLYNAEPLVPIVDEAPWRTARAGLPRIGSDQAARSLRTITVCCPMESPSAHAQTIVPSTYSGVTTRGAGTRWTRRTTTGTDARRLAFRAAL